VEITKLLYIDPGTGGMLFTVLFGIFGVLAFSLRSLFMKLKYSSAGKQNARISSTKIPVVIFNEHKRYWNIFEPIMDELDKNDIPITYMTCSEDDPAFKRKFKNINCEYIGEGNKAFSRLNLLNANVVFATTPSLDVFQWKRSKYVDCYIHIMHAAKDLTMYRMYGTDHYDAFILGGEYQEKQARQMEEMRGIKPRDIALCGVPYLDVMKKRVEDAGEVPPHDRTVLLAPSWGESGILTRFGDRLIDALISTGYTIIVRPHPQSFASEKDMLEKLMAKYNDPSKVEWNRDTDNFEVLRRSDVLISDYSAVMFEFAMVFNKPVIYTDTKFDIRPYDADWIDEVPWTFRILPDLGIELNESNVNDIRNVIDRCIEDPSFTTGREKARRDTWVHIGESAKRSSDFIIKKYHDTVSDNISEEQKTDTDNRKNSKRIRLANSRG